jgi:zinc transporter ZupT
MLLLVAISAFIATLLGGLFAIRLKDKLHLILGFSAGAVVAVAFFDLLPEAIALGGKYYEPSTIFTISAVGFIIYMILDRLVFLHSHDIDQSIQKNNPRGILGASSLSFHSFLDGVAIGLAFQVSLTVGTIVAVAVLTHDFSDGINTVSMIIKNEGNKKEAMKWLFVDAIAPVVGAFSTMFFHVPQKGLGIILALFSGFFLYIGASDLIPESHHAHPKLFTTVMTVIGVAVLYFAIRIASL